MKVYRVITERDGSTTKADGTTSTEIIRMDTRYAANNMEQVWDAVKWIRDDPEQSLFAIIEEAPQIDVIGKGSES